MDGIHDGTDLAQVLELFESLPALVQATALQKIQARQLNAHANDEPAEAHSCRLCESFGLSRHSPERNRALRTLLGLPDSVAGVAFPRHLPYYSSPRSLTKEALLQGLSRRCLLFQWISKLLDRALGPVKAEVAQKGILIQGGARNVSGIFLQEALDDSEHNLAHIDPARGLDVRISIDKIGTVEGTLTPKPQLGRQTLASVT
jgi:hypothetical protein